MAEGVWKVIQFVSGNRDRARTVFEGIEKDARKFIADHFPRTHLEPNSPDEPLPDAHIVSPDGTHEQFSAENGFSTVEDGA